MKEPNWSSKGPGILLSMSYWMGIITAFALMMTFQDYLGKDAYIQMLQDDWVAGDWSGLWVLWLIIAVICTSAHIWLKSKINQKSVEIKEDK